MVMFSSKSDYVYHDESDFPESVKSFLPVEDSCKQEVNYSSPVCSGVSDNSSSSSYSSSSDSGSSSSSDSGGCD